MEIRTAKEADIEKIVAVEQLCFPEAEAATKETIEKRVERFGNRFWLLYDQDILVGFVNGMVTNAKDLRDEMYEKVSLHNEQGGWQMIFGVDIIPEYRNHGWAEYLLCYVIAEVKKENKKGIVLTCKDKLVHYYAKFGFENEGISQSTHGDVQWYQMRLEF